MVPFWLEGNISGLKLTFIGIINRIVNKKPCVDELIVIKKKVIKSTSKRITLTSRLENTLIFHDKLWQLITNSVEIN